MMKRRLALLLALLLLPAAALAEAAAQQAQDVRRTVYLTFDDGPKQDTPELLELLRELDVPATFFLVGAAVEAFPENAKAILAAGHAVGCHSMTHSYSNFKSGEERADREIARFMQTMRELVDPAFTTDLFRFPGGSTSYNWRMKAHICEQGFAWIDWNVMTGDAHRTFKNDEEMLRYTLDQVRGQEVVILLMHEAKPRTRRVLPDLVAYFCENGYAFRTLSTGEEDREILSRCKVNLRMPETATE